MTRRHCLNVLLLPLAAFDANWVRRVNRTQLRLVKAFNDWQTFCSTLSPHSPDLKQRIQERWLQNEVSQWFRKLESALRS